MRKHGHLIVLLLLIVLAFVLRVVPLHSTVFTSAGTVLLENDPYYHIRLAENLAANFPLPLARDAFIGNTIPYFPLMSYLIVIPAWIMDCSYESWAALISPLAFVALLVVVYLLGKILISKWAGVLAVAIVSFLPTELFHRSLLGFADHHVLEVLFVSLVFLYLLSAEKTGRWQKYGLLGGGALSLYIWCWKGAPLYLFVFIVISVAAVLFGKDKKSLCAFHFLSGLFALIMLIPLLVYFSLPFVYFWAVVLYMVAPYIVYQTKRVIGTRLTLGILIAVVAGLAFVFRSYIAWTLLPATGVGVTISEATPAGTYILVVMGVAIAPYLVGLWASKDKRDVAYMIVAAWSLAAIFMFAIQMRWSYYLSVPFALMTTAGVYYIVERVKRQVQVGVAIALVFFILLPGVASTPQITDSKPLYTTSLQQAMDWLGENTPEPFALSGGYLELCQAEPDYEVASWWPNGFFIIYGAHRAPVTDPTQRDADVAARFFVYGIGNPEYVLVDSTMVDTFPGMVQTLGGTWEQGEQAYQFSFLKRLIDNEADRYEKIYSNEEVTIWSRE